MNHSSHHHEPPTTWPVSWLLSAMALVLVAVAWMQWSQKDTSQEALAPQWQRHLVFADSPDGDILVKDFPQGAVIARFEGEQGFMRGTLRAMARERRSRNLGSELPFELVAHGQGRLTLIDPSTQYRIDLESFGPTQMAKFAQLRDAQAITP